MSNDFNNNSPDQVIEITPDDVKNYYTYNVGVFGNCLSSILCSTNGGFSKQIDDYIPEKLSLAAKAYAENDFDGAAEDKDDFVGNTWPSYIKRAFENSSGIIEEKYIDAAKDAIENADTYDEETLYLIYVLDMQYLAILEALELNHEDMDKDLITRIFEKAQETNAPENKAFFLWFHEALQAVTNEPPAYLELGTVN